MCHVIAVFVVLRLCCSCGCCMSCGRSVCDSMDVFFIVCLFLCGLHECHVLAVFFNWLLYVTWLLCL